MTTPAKLAEFQVAVLRAVNERLRASLDRLVDAGTEEPGDPAKVRSLESEYADDKLAAERAVEIINAAFESAKSDMYAARAAGY